MTIYYSDFNPIETADGAKGSAAFLGSITTALVYLYKRSATALLDANKPNGDVVYTFATGSTNISAVTNGWTITIPSGTDPLYVVAATATGTDPTDTIASTEWSSPVILAQNGLAGTSAATIFLFKRSTTNTAPAVPTQTATYTFASGVLLGTSSAGNTISPYLDGWSQTAPDSSSGKYLFVTTATAISTGTTDTILTTEWAAVKILAESGAMGYTAYLTNETHTLLASSTGVVSSYTGATGSFNIYLDGVGDISSSFTLSTVAGSNPQSLTIGYSGNVYTVSGGFDSGEDVATVTIRATGSGAYSAVIIDKVFSLSKSKTGADGSPAKVISIATDRQIISYDGAGNLSPTTQTAKFSISKQNTTGTVNWTIKDTAGNTLTPATYLSSDLAGTTPASSGDIVYLTAAKFQAAISVNGAQGIVLTATVVDVVTLIDQVTVMKVKSGADGSPGSPGSAGAAAVTAYATNEAQSLFAYADGTVVSFSTANGLFKIYSGSTDVTSSADLFTATASGCTGTINTAANTPVNGQPIGYYQITAMSADTATLTLSARYPATTGTIYTKIFTLTKTRGGYEIVSVLPTTNLFQGRMAFLTTDNKLYRYNGSSWAASVASTDISGQLIGSQIADSAITTAKFASTIEPVTVVSSVPTTKSTNSIFNTTDGKLYRWSGTAYIASVPSVDITGALTDSQIAAVSAAKLTGQIISTQITDSAITTAKLAAGSVTASQIAADTITAGNIAAGAITTSELAANAVTATKIAAGTITSNEIAADTITAGNIAAGAVTASEIAAGAITASKLFIGSQGSALNLDPSMADPSAWTTFEGTTAVFTTITTGKVGNNVARSPTGTSVSMMIESKKIAVDPNKTYRVRSWLRTVSGTGKVAFVGVCLYDSAGAIIGGDGTFWYYIGGTALTPPSTFTEYYGSFGLGTSKSIPSNARTMAPVFILSYGATGSSIHEIQDLRIEEVLPGTLIQSGSITTDKIAANTITASNIAADTITATQIATDAITANEISAGAITAAKVGTNEIIAVSANIKDGVIASAKIGDLQVNSAKIANLTIGTQKIEDLAVTRSSSLKYDFAGFNYTTDNVWFDLAKSFPGGYQYVGYGSGDYEYQDTGFGFELVYVGPGLGDYTYVSGGVLTLATSIATTTVTAAAAQVVNIDVILTVERDGGSDDNISSQVVRTNDGFVLGSYSTLRARNGKSTYSLFFIDANPIPNVINTYKVQVKNLTDNSRYYECSIRAVLYRK